MDRQTLYVDVVLSLPLRQLFTYEVAPEFAEQCDVGKRVVVQFSAQKFYTALVVKLHHNAPKEYKPKMVIDVIDEQPVVLPLHITFWKWVADYYLASLGEVYRAALPSAMKLESETFLILHPEFDLDGVDWVADFKPNELEVVQFLKDGKRKSIKDIQKHSSLKNPLPLLKRLISRDILDVYESMDTQRKAKTEKFIKLADRFRSEELLSFVVDSLNRAKKQQSVLIAFLELCAGVSEQVSDYVKYQIPKATLVNKTGTSNQIVNELVKKEIFEEKEVKVGIVEYGNEPFALPALTPHQQEAFDNIKQNFETKNTVLLHGVTGSGKTEVYIRLIDEFVQQGKQVLYLLPEIALTTQIITRLRNYFGNKIGVYHSKFRSNERADVWDKILENNLDPRNLPHQIVIGVRSAVFLPFSNLGLVIVDEEHETTFKQFDPSPRYHARDAAVVLASLHKAKVLLGTATPSAESFYNAKTGKFGYVELTQRFHDVAMPEILVADVKDAKKRKKMRSIFTAFLIEKIADALQKKEQVILFQNRRGFSPYLQCDQCGWIPQCEHCDVSLTYHKHRNILSCHYCGFGLHGLHACKKCGAPELKVMGFGTERIEEELQIFFPDARIERLDQDSTTKKNAYEERIAKFTSGEIDILVGTQMVTKGLDFEHVNTVGIMNADAMLNFPDFRANERSFQLMEQVSGRAGRKNKQGQVVVQTTMPEHHVIGLVQKHDATSLLRMELSERKQFLYPPFVRIVRLTIKHKLKANADAAAKQLAVYLKSVAGIVVLGPEAPLVERLRGMYVQQIMIKITDKQHLQHVKNEILRMVLYLKTLPMHRSCSVLIDVDPY